MPTATISSAPFLVREQQREVLADPGREHGVVRQTESVEPLGARGAAVAAVRVDDDLRGAAAQRLVGDRVHVADDHVGLAAGSSSASAPPSTRDEHGPEVADVRADDAQVALHPGAARDDERVAVAEARAQHRELDAAGEHPPSSRR